MPICSLQKANLGSWNTFGERVRNHLCGGNEVGIDHTVFHLISEPVEAKVQVFHTTMMLLDISVQV